MESKTDIAGISLQTIRNKVPKWFGKVTVQLRRGVLGYKEQHLRMSRRISLLYY